MLGPPSNPPPPTISRLLDLTAFAGFVMLLALKAYLVADITWDTLAYHLPFAARSAGMMDEATFAFTAWLEQCFDGFPRLPYSLYGRLWRFTGDPNTANLVSIAAFAGFCLLIARHVRAPLTIVAAAVAAIPVIHVNLGSTYTDLLANLSFAAAVVLATLTVIEPEREAVPRIMWAAVCAALAANTKLQFIALVGLLAIAYGVAMVVVRIGGQRLGGVIWPALRRAPAWQLLALIVAIIAGAAPAIDNLITHGNPVYPIGIAAFGTQILPGATASTLYGDPQYLADDPAWLRWILSVLEFRALGFRHVPYTIGQGNVPTDAESLRMGGYLSLFVVYNLIILVTGAASRGGRVVWAMAAFLGLTPAVALLPAAHELRYYSFWMIVLVVFNIALIWRWNGSSADRRHFAAVAVASLVFVSAVTGFRHVSPWDIQLWLAPRVADPATLAELSGRMRLPELYRPQLVDGGRYCLVNWGPYPLLGTQVFHPERKFSVVMPEGTACPPGTTVIDLQALRSQGP